MTLFGGCERGAKYLSGSGGNDYECFLRMRWWEMFILRVWTLKMHCYEFCVCSTEISVGMTSVIVELVMKGYRKRKRREWLVNLYFFSVCLMDAMKRNWCFGDGFVSLLPCFSFISAGLFLDELPDIFIKWAKSNY